MSESESDLNGRIDHCPSAAHRSVLGLVRAALGYPVGPNLIDDLGASKPEDNVRNATFTTSMS